MGAGYGNPPQNFEKPIAAAPVVKAEKHKKHVLHSHDATRPTHSDAVSDINITPLIDVMLVLLIIFMVVTPVAQKGMDIALPQANTQQQNTPPPSASNQVVLSLDESGISVNKSPVGTLEELDGRLKDIFQTRADKTMFVKASGKVLYGKVVEAMDVAKGAGVERIGIISESMTGEGEVPAGAPAAPGAP